jgi:hypothetical protein
MFIFHLDLNAKWEFWYGLLGTSGSHPLNFIIPLKNFGQFTFQKWTYEVRNYEDLHYFT